jgi:hypothetical protein
MPDSFAHLVSCSDLRPSDLVAATASRDTCETLLLHFAHVSSPKSGAPAILALFAHIASQECPWREGDLAVELLGAGDMTRVRVMQELAGGMRERLLPTVVLDAPLEEIATAIERFPAILGDITATVTSRCIQLGRPTIEEVPASMAFEISERSISGIPTAPVQDDVDVNWDDALTA